MPTLLSTLNYPSQSASKHTGTYYEQNWHVNLIKDLYAIELKADGKRVYFPHVYKQSFHRRKKEKEKVV